MENTQTDDIQTFSPTHPELNTAAPQPAAPASPAAPTKEAASAEDKSTEEPAADKAAEDEASSEKPDKEISDAARKLRQAQAKSRAEKREQQFQARIDAKRRELGDIDREIERKRRELAGESGKRTPEPKDNGRDAASADDTAPTDQDVTRPQPKVEDFDSYEQFLDARDEWRDEQREYKAQKADRARAEQQEQNQYLERANAFKAEFSDFDAVVADSSLELHPTVIRALRKSEHGPAIIYSLCKNAKESDAFGELPVADQLKEIGRRETRFEARAKAQAKASDHKPTSSAPEPIEPVGGASALPKALEDLDVDDYIDAKNAAERKAGRR